MKTKEEILEENGFDFEAFALENEYSAKNLLAAMEQYAKQHITDTNKIAISHAKKH